MLQVICSSSGSVVEVAISVTQCKDHSFGFYVLFSSQSHIRKGTRYLVCCHKLDSVPETIPKALSPGRMPIRKNAHLELCKSEQCPSGTSHDKFVMGKLFDRHCSDGHGS